MPIHARSRGSTGSTVPTCAALVRNYLEVYWPCAGGLSAVNVIGTQLRGDSINSGLTRWRMVVLNKEMDAAAEIGGNPVSKHQIQPEYGDEQAGAGRDCRTRLARPNSQARTRTGKYSFFPVQLTPCRFGNLTRLIHPLVICVTIQQCTVFYTLQPNLMHPVGWKLTMHTRAIKN